MKKILFIIAACLLALSFTGIVSGNVQAETTKTFKDVKANTETGKAIYSMVERGVLSGYPDGTFKPNQPITNAQAAKMIAGALDFTYDEISGPYYTDVPKTHSNYKYIMAVKDALVFESKSGKQFKPNEYLPRLHMAQILTAAYALYITDDKKVELPFTDLLTDAHKKVVMPLYVHNITKGKTATTFGRTDAVTRGQFATFIYRIEQKIAKGELTGRQATLLWARDVEYYLESELRDAKGNIIDPSKYTKTNSGDGVNVYRYKPEQFGVYVVSSKQKSGLVFEQVHEVGNFNNRLLTVSGQFVNEEGWTLEGNSLRTELRLYEEKNIKLLAVDATLAPSIHSTYEETLSVEEKIINGEKRFFMKILKPGRTIVQFTYEADGVKNTANVYYVTGFLNEKPYLLFHKNVEVK